MVHVASLRLSSCVDEVEPALDAHTSNTALHETKNPTSCKLNIGRISCHLLRLLSS